MSIAEIRMKIAPILRSYGIKHAGLFGSTARGMARSGSDIDILVGIKKNIGLIEFVGIKQALEDKLGRQVDLVEYQTIKPALRKKILHDEIKLL